MARSFVVRARIEAEDRASKQIEKIQTNAKSFDSAMRRLGVTLEKDVNATLKRNAVILEEARKSYEKGAITLRDYESAQRAVAAANEEITKRFSESAQDTKSFEDALRSLGVTLDRDVNEAISRNAALLDDARRNYEQGSITLRDYDAVQRAVAEANTRVAQQFRESADASKGFESELRRLGVTLEGDVNASLSKNAFVLEEARRSYEAGQITLRDYEATQRAVAASNAKLSQSLRESGAAAASADRGFAGVASSLSSFALRIAAPIVGLAALTRGLKNAVTGALEQEDAERRRAAALERSGGASEALVAGLDAQAAALQKVTKFSDDAVIGLQGYLSTLGVSADRLSAATQVTLDLASAFDLDLNAAARSVSQVLRGEVGREIGRLIPELKELKEQGLLTAEGFDFLAERVKNASFELGRTRSGALTGLGNDLGDLGESFVNAAVGGKDFAESVTKIRDAAQATEPAISGLGRVINEFVGGSLNKLGQLSSFVRTTPLDLRIQVGEAFPLLDRIENRIREILSLSPIELETNVVGAELSAEKIQDLTDHVNHLRAFFGLGPLKVEVDADTEPAKRKLDEVESQTQRVASTAVKVKVDADTDEADAKIKGFGQRFRELQDASGRVTITADLEDKKAAEKIDELKAKALEASRAQIIFTPQVDAGPATEAFDAIVQSGQRVSETPIEIRPQVFSEESIAAIERIHAEGAKLGEARFTLTPRVDTEPFDFSLAGILERAQRASETPIEMVANLRTEAAMAGFDTVAGRAEEVARTEIDLTPKVRSEGAIRSLDDVVDHALRAAATPIELTASLLADPVFEGLDRVEARSREVAGTPIELAPSVRTDGAFAGFDAIKAGALDLVQTPIDLAPTVRSEEPIARLREVQAVARSVVETPLELSVELRDADAVAALGRIDVLKREASSTPIESTMVVRIDEAVSSIERVGADGKRVAEDLAKPIEVQIRSDDARAQLAEIAAEAERVRESVSGRLVDVRVSGTAEAIAEMRSVEDAAQRLGLTVEQLASLRIDVDTAEAIAGFEGLDVKAQQLGLTVEQLQAKLALNIQTTDALVSLGALEQTAQRLGITVEELRIRLALNVEVTRNLAAATDTLAASQTTAAVSANAMEAAALRAAAAETQQAAAILEIGEAAKQLGITLESEAIAKLDLLNARVETIRAGLATGASTINDYRAAQAAATQQAAALGLALDGTTLSVREQAAATGELGKGLRSLAQEQRVASQENQRYAASARQAASAQAAFNAQVGRVVARSPSQQGAVDAAVAAGIRPILGGTRQPLIGGGSRLVRVF